MKRNAFIAIKDVVIVISASIVVLFNSCSSDEKIEQIPETPKYDSIYNSAYGLYVIDNDTVAYNPNAGSDFNSFEKNIGKSLSEYAVKMLIDYGQNEKLNTVLSPLCATTLYSMMSNFSDGESNNNEYKDEMNINTISTEDINSYHRKIADKESESSANENSETTFSVENNLWMKEGKTVYRSFLSTSRAYGVKVKGINLDNVTEINKLNTSIKNHSGSPSAGINSPSFKNLESLVSSSLSFKQFWKESFYVDSTHYKFKNGEGDSVICKMLIAQRSAHYAHFSDFDMIEIPYKEEKFSMYIMLPNESSTLVKSLTDLYHSGLDKCMNWVSDTTRRYHNEQIVNEIDTLISDTIVYIQFPQFKYSGTAELYSSSSSPKVTMKSQLYEKNLHKVSPNGYKLGNIYQSCFLDVNRDGTSATAKGVGEIPIVIHNSSFKTNEMISIVKPIGMSNTPRGKRIQKTVIEPFIVNRPFAVFIRDQKNKTIPFSACISNI